MNHRKKIIVIGGSAAGPKAAAKARRLDPYAEITIIQKDSGLSMASCGYPYYLSGRIKDRKSLLTTAYGIVRDPDFFESTKGILAVIETEVSEIDRKNHNITCNHRKTGEMTRLDYDKLIIATGADAKMPPVPGNTLSGISTLHSLSDVDYLKNAHARGNIKQAVVIGGGLIGIETCEALRQSGIQVTVVEMLPQLLAFLDWEIAKLVENHVRNKAVKVITNLAVSEFVGNGKLQAVKLNDGTILPCELAVVAVGVSPNTKLARNAKLFIGKLGESKSMNTCRPPIPTYTPSGTALRSITGLRGTRHLLLSGILPTFRDVSPEKTPPWATALPFPEPFKPASARCLIFPQGQPGYPKSGPKPPGLTLSP